MGAEANIRRYQSILICSGYGVIAFGLWTLVKILMLLFLDPLGFHEYFDYETLDSDFVNMIVYIISAVLMGVDLLIRIYIGFSAVADGNGKKKRWKRYVAITKIYAFMTMLSVAVMLLPPYDTSAVLNTVTSSIIEVTSGIAMIEIIISSNRLRKLTA